jgi:hypothetical protein
MISKGVKTQTSKQYFTVHDLILFYANLLMITKNSIVKVKKLKIELVILHVTL